jgi:TPR repeat protein
MIYVSTPFTSLRRNLDHPLASGLRIACGLLLVFAVTAAPGQAESLASARSAYAHGDYVRSVTTLTPLALRGNAQAQAMLGFLYENGFGTPQAYEVAADLYCQAAMAGNPFGQAMLGLMYDKGHGVPQDVVLAYKWMDLAAGRAGRGQREYYLRLRNAIASKMSPGQIAQGQQLALSWVAGQR